MTRGFMVTAAVVVVVLVGFALVQGGVFGRPTASVEPSSSVASVAPPSTRPPPSANSPRPSATPVDPSVVASAVVVPLRSADVASRLSGTVASVYVQDGSDAESGQLLVKLDQATYVAAIGVAEAALRRANATVEQAQLQLEQLPPDASPGQVEAVQANVRVAEAEHALAESTLAEAQTALQQTEVRAPFAGTVADVVIAAGEQAIAGQTLLTIGDTSGWLIETTDLSELEVVRVAVGDRTAISFDALPGRTIEGTVERIQVRGTSAAGGVVFAVAIRPDATSVELRWGMSATVRIRPSG
jgi:RND family efflux transporter MFP subunit